MGAGKKRSITFQPGQSEQEIIEAKGILKGDLVVYINEGMPNTSSKIVNIENKYSSKSLYLFLKWISKT